MTRVSFATGALLFTTVFAAAAVDRGGYAESLLN